MSVATVITGGFGSFGTIALVIRDGYGSGAYVPPVVPAVPSGVAHGGGGIRWSSRERPKRRRASLAEVVDLAVQEVVTELRRAGDGQVQEQVAAIVAPHVVKPKPRSRPRVDYDALEADVAAVRQLVALLREQRQREIDEDEEEAMIYAAL